MSVGPPYSNVRLKFCSHDALTVRNCCVVAVTPASANEVRDCDWLNWLARQRVLKPDWLTHAFTATHDSSAAQLFKDISYLLCFVVHPFIATIGITLRCLASHSVITKAIVLIDKLYTLSRWHFLPPTRTSDIRLG